ncbi:Rop guanyl-nucleotide exchange factor 3 [Tanacetum coccineum]
MVVSLRPRSDIFVNLLALRKLDNMLLFAFAEQSLDMESESDEFVSHKEDEVSKDTQNDFSFTTGLGPNPSNKSIIAVEAVGRDSPIVDDRLSNGVTEVLLS